jgi:hypothetical protein
MGDHNKIHAINRVIKEYFDSHPGEGKVPSKDLMPDFVKACIFQKDLKGGLPIRKVLRNMDKSRQLHVIPYAHPERKQKNTNWFFIRTNSKKAVLAITEENSQSTVSQKPIKRKTKDEGYVLALCDDLLMKKSLRQHRFDFLRGDARTKLPVDGYYPELNLVIEYRERQHTEPVKHFDKPDKMTVSGVHRGEQRRLYDARRREVLAKQQINLIEIPYSLFNCDSNKRIIRRANDKATLKTFLSTRV